MHILNIINNLFLIFVAPENSIILSQIIRNLVLKYVILLKSAIFLLVLEIFCVRLQGVGGLGQLLV